MDRTQEPGRRGRVTGHGAAGAAREGATDVVQESVAQGRDLYERLREQAVDETGVQLRRLATHIRYLSTDLRHMGDSAKPDSPAAPLVRRVADGGHGFADHLERRGAGELLDDVRQFARRRPGLFLAAAVAAGFAVSRVGRGVGAAEPGTTGAPVDEGPQAAVPAYAPDPALETGEGPPPMPRLGTSATPAPGPPSPEPPRVPPPETGKGW
ncbi:hypothetical protein [Streptomyces sp. NPDC059063]|uniref:hypothetical protein n=1 Tax=unclassified Streptomyces TaxID=2593676 RepID=UPI0036827A87